MAYLIVGNEDCKFLEVVNALTGSSSAELLYFGKWTEIARELDISAEDIQTIRQGLLLQTLRYFEAYHAILMSWKGKKSGAAKLGVLINVLDKVGLKDSADHLRVTFRVRAQPSQAAPKFVKALPGLEDFLKNTNPQSALIISTLSCAVTLLKIRDTIQQPMELIDEISLQDHFSLSDKNSMGLIQCNSPVSTILPKMKKFPHVKIVLLTEETIEGILGNIMDFGNVAFKTIVDDIRWTDLDEEFSAVLLNQIVLIQEREITLIEALTEAGAENSLQEILNGKTLVELMKPESSSMIMYLNKLLPELKYYIPRTVISAVILNPKQIFKTSKDIFLFSGKDVHPVIRKFAAKERVENASRQIANGAIKARLLLISLKSEFDDICKMTNHSIHWLNYEDGEFIWVKSIGDLTSIREAICMALDYNEDAFVAHILSKDIIDRSRMPVCISDMPGMGKSVLLSNIGRNIVKTNPKTLVQFVTLSKFMTKLSNELKEGDNLSDILLQSLADYSCSIELGAKIFKTGIQSGKLQLELLLDGYDEINSSNLELTNRCLKEFTKSFPSIRIIVTTRPHLLRTLENILYVLGYRIMPFDLDDQLNFLTEYWARNRTLDEKKLKDFSVSCLSKLNESMTEKDNDIAGIPLQCLLIGKVFKTMARNNSDPENELSTDATPEIGSITELFERVVDLQLRRYGEKFSVEIGDKDKWMMRHAMEALQLLFPQLAACELAEYESNISREDLLKVGILVSNDINEAPEFIHRLFAEFFIAWLTHRQLGEAASIKLPLDTILSTHLVEVELKGHLFELVDVSARTFTHYMVAYFLNNLLKKENEHSNITNGYVASCPRPQMKEITEAGAHASFQQIFHLFLHSLGRQNLYEDPMPESAKDSLIVVVWQSDVEILETLFPIYQNSSSEAMHDFRIETYKDCPISLLDVALCRGDLSVVEFLLNEQDFSKLVKASALKLLLHSCVDDSDKDSQKTIQDKSSIIQDLVEIEENKNLLKERDIRGRTPLLCSNIHIDLLKELVQLGADVLTVNNVGNGTVLHKATQYLSKDQYEKLITFIPDLKLERLMKIRDEMGRTPLQCVVGAFDPTNETLQRFNDLSADMNSKNYTDDADTVLMTAVKERRKVECLKQLIRVGANWNIKTEEGRSLLHIVLEMGHTGAAKLLMDLGADLNEKDEDGNTPFHLAIFQNHINHLEMLDSLVEFNLNLTLVNEDEHTYLHLAALHKRVELARVLIQRHANVNAGDWRSNTPLHFALFPVPDAPTKEGTLDIDVFEMAKLLIDNGAEINALNRYKRTPLVHALKIPDNILDIRTLEILPLPVDTKSDEAATKGMRSLLSTTCLNDEYGFKELANYYLAHADLEYEDTTENRTFLHIAAQSGNHFGVRYLCDHKLNVNSKDSDGNTPLHLAAKSRDETMHEIVECLVDYGCKLNLENKKGLTPLKLLITENPENSKIETLLLLNGDEISKEELAITTFKSLVGKPWDLNDVDNNLKTAKAFISAGANLNSIDNNGNTLLHIASRNGSVEAVRLLVDYGIPINVTNIEQNTPLHLALLNNSDRFRKQDDPFTKIEDGSYFPKSRKINKGMRSVCSKLKFPMHNKGIYAKTQKSHYEASQFYESKFTFCRFPIFILEETDEDQELEENSLNIRIGAQLEIVTFLFERKCRTDSKNKDGFTPLEYAINEAGSIVDIEVFKKLYSRESSLSLELITKSLYHITTILKQFISDKECIRFLRKFVRMGQDHIDYTHPHAGRFLHHCSKLGNLAAFQFFASLGCDISAQTRTGHTILDFAPLEMTPEQFHVLLEIVISKGKGFLLNFVNNIYGEAVLHNAVFHLELLQSTLNLFKKWDADFNAVDKNGSSVLWWAIASKRSGNFIGRLVGCGVNIKYVSKNENTNALMIACQGGNFSTFNLLLQGIDLNSCDKYGYSSLNFACFGVSKLKIRFIRALLEKGVSADKMDLLGCETPLHTLFRETNLKEWTSFMIGKPALYNVFKYLLTQGASIRAVGEGGATPLHYGAETLPPEILHDVITHLKDTKETTSFISVDEKGNLPVYYSALNTNILFETLELFSAQIEEWHSTSNNLTKKVLLAAVLGGRNRAWIKSYLCAHPIDHHDRNEYFNTLLQYAAAGGNLSAFRYILSLETGAHFNTPDQKGRTSLQLAVASNKYSHELTEFLVVNGANVNSQNNNGRTAVHGSVNSANLDALKLLISSGANLNTPDKNGNTALHCAVSRTEYNHEMTKFLIEKGADVNIQDNNGRSSIHFSVNEGNLDTLKLLISSGANPNTLDKNGNTALRYAVLKKEYNHELTEFLIGKGADVNLVDNNGRTAVYDSVCLGNLGAFLPYFLISSGANLNTADSNGNTPLHSAVCGEEYNHTLTEFLIGNGADVNSEDNEGSTAVHYAVNLGNLDALKLLISSGANLNTPDTNRNTALHYAVLKKEYNQELTEFLIRKGAGVNSQDNEGCTAVHYAVSHENLAALKLLISSGADLNTPDINGNTALHYAVSNDEYNHELAQFLIGKGADANAQNNDGCTAVYDSVNSLNLEALKLLISSGGDLNISDRNQRTPLHLAILSQKYNHDYVGFLISEGADVNFCDQYAVTPLHFAVSASNIDVVKLLVSCGSDMNSRDADGNTPLNYAFQSHEDQQYEIAKFLIQSNASVNVVDLNEKSTASFAVLAYSNSETFKTSEIFELLISKGADLSFVTRSGSTILSQMTSYLTTDHFQAILQHVLLLGKEAWLFYGGHFNETLLHCASQNLELNVNTLALLHQQNLDFNVVDLLGNSVLAYAILGNRTSHFLLTLLQLGAEYRSTNKNDENVLHMATIAGNLEALQFFLAMTDVDVNYRNFDGNTPLHLLKPDLKNFDQQCIIVACLIEAGADVNISNHYGFIPKIMEQFLVADWN